MRGFLLGLVVVSSSVGWIASSAQAGAIEGFEVGAQTGLGYDSNMFNTPSSGPSSRYDALSNETTVKGKYKNWLTKRLRSKSGLGLTSSYRYADSDAQAWKLQVKAGTGLEWKMFGMKKKEDPFRPAGKLGLALAYAGTFNPTLDNPSPFDDENDIDDQDEIDDLLEDDAAFDGLDEDFFDLDEGDADDDGDWDTDSEGEDDSYFDEDPLSGKFFNNKANRNIFSPALAFNLRPTKPMSLTFAANYALGVIQQIDPTKPSSDFQQVGGAVKWRQHIVPKILDLAADFGFGYRWWDEKTAPSGALLESWPMSWGVGAKVRPIKRLKLLASYRYGLRIVPINSPSDGWQHIGRVGVQWKIAKGWHVFEDNSFLYSGIQDNSSRDAFRFQMIAGLRWNI